MTKPQDFLGRDIVIGAIVVYPSREGSSMWLTKSQVTDIKLNGSQWTLCVRPMGQLTKPKRIGRNVPVERTVVVG